MGKSSVMSNFVKLLRLRADQHPDKIIYTFLKDGEHEEGYLTYGALDQRARSVAAYLQGAGIAPGSPAILLYPQGFEFISAFFGCLYAGVIAVPAYPPHPSRLERDMARLMGMINNAKPAAVLTFPMLARMVLERDGKGHPLPGKIQWIVTSDIGDDMAGTWREPEITGQTIAFLQYTSGSTGDPKGVIVSHANLMHNEQMIQEAYGTAPGSLVVSWLPLYHDMGLIGMMMNPIYGNFSCVLMSPVAFLQKPIRWLRAVSHYKAVTTGGPNFAYELCIRRVMEAEKKTLDLSSWEIAFNGSEPVRKNTLDRFYAAFSVCGFRREAFYACYGLAEATLMVSGRGKNGVSVFQCLEAKALTENQVVPVHEENSQDPPLVGSGRVVEGLDVAIVNPETLMRRAPNQVGEIWISGPSVAGGYWQRPNATAETFGARMDGEPPEKTWLRTGDMGFFLDEQLFITGRLKDLIIIRGRNHYPQDIELTVEQSYPAIRPGCCAAFSVEENGEERLVIVAEVERRYRRKIGESEQEILEAAEKDERRQVETLPVHIPPMGNALDYKEAVQAIRGAVSENHELQVYAVALIKVGSIPKTTSGKVRRRSCRDGFLAGTLETVARDVTASFVLSVVTVPDMCRLHECGLMEKRNMLECYLKELTAWILKIPLSDVKTDTPLTTLGLDSLASVEIQHRMESDTGIQIPMTEFLRGASIAELIEESLKTPLLPEMEIPLLPLSDRIPLSFNQNSLWFLYQLAPDSAAYNVFFAVRIVSELNVLALVRSFDQLISRHPVLRTAYHAGDGSPIQRIQTERSLDFSEINASDWTDDRLNTALASESHRPFDLEKGPILRISLFHRKNEHILLLNVHHIAVDLWSLTVLMDELRILYTSEIEGKTVDLPVPGLTYAEYVHWQQEMLDGPAGDRLWTYWRDRLKGIPPALSLPADHPRPRVQTYHGAAWRFKLDRVLTRRIKNLGMRFQATLYMTLLAAFQTLLHRYTGQTDILVGSPTVGRNRSEFHEIVGYFANPVVIRADLSDDPGFGVFLSQVRERVLEALAHQDYPFQLLVERLQPVRDPAFSPLFQAMFVLEKPLRLKESAPFVTGDPDARMSLGPLEIISVPLPHRMAQFDLTLMMVETTEGLSASLEYNAGLFEAETIQRMAGHFQTLLTRITADPELPLSRLPLLTQAETRAILADWSAPSVRVFRTQTVLDLIDIQASTSPDRPAIVSGSKTISFKDLIQSADTIAHYLRDVHEIRTDDRVGVLLDRSEWSVSAMLAVLKSGAAYVPVDPAYPPERIRFMIEDSGCKAVLTEEAQAEFLKSFYPKKQTVDIRRIPHPHTGDADADIGPENLSYVIYTSGSTGSPKGVMQTHRCLSNLIAWQMEETGGGWRILQYAATGFDVSMQETLYSLASGSTLYVIPQTMRYDMPVLAEFILRHRIEMITLPFSALNLLFRENAMFKGDSPLRHIITSGEALRVFPELRRFLEERPQVKLHNQYGPTETHVVTAHTISAEQGNITEYPPIGRPVSNTEILILDQGLKPVPAGIIGEIYAAGDNLARGYLNRDDLTRERFIPHPFEKDGRMYRTGDIGRWFKDGTIEFLGRNDDQVKIRGYRVELGEIETCLLRHPDIREAVVLARKVQGETELAAYVSGPEKLGPADMRTHLKKFLPFYMIPAHIIRVDGFQFTAHGKVDKKSLPDPSRMEPIHPEYIPPRTEIEKRITEIWESVLGVQKAGLSDNFFESGGHSLKAAQMAGRIRKEMRVDLPLREIFTNPVLESLAAYIARAQAVSDEPIEPADDILPATGEEIRVLKKLLEGN